MSSFDKVIRSFEANADMLRQYEASVKRRNSQMDSFMLHLVAVMVTEILETSQEDFVEVTIPFETDAIYVSTVSALLASRGLDVYAKMEGQNEWVLANISNMTRDAIVTCIAVKSQKSDASKENTKAVNSVKEEIEELEQKLERAKDSLMSFKRKVEPYEGISVIPEGREDFKRQKYRPWK